MARRVLLLDVMKTNSTPEHDLWLEKISDALRSLRQAGLRAVEDGRQDGVDRPRGESSQRSHVQ